MRRRSGKSRDLASGIETTVFRSGNSDAVRLPKGLALGGKRVRLRRLDDGRVVIELVRRRRWPPGFLDTFGRVTVDFDAPPRPGPTIAGDDQTARLFEQETRGAGGKRAR